MCKKKVARQKLLWQAPGSWISLGGSEGATAFLKSKHDDLGGTALTSCMGAEVKEAEKICAKHLQKGNDFFTDCMFDVCHGGGEADAQSAAALLAA